MDVKIIENINNVVQPNDFLYFLGDWCFARREEYSTVAEGYRNRINCKNIVLIWGNHDKRGRNDPKFLNLFNSCHDILEVNNKFLCHYAMKTWNKSHRKVVHLFGHSHGNLPDDPNSLSCDVGVDCFDHKPVSEGEIQEFMKKKQFKALDHHTG
jgi:calcineurin-like phosphoesterase family protein